MDCFVYSANQTNFECTSSDSSYSVSFCDNLCIPLQSNVKYREISHLLINNNRVPVFLENEVTNKLKHFIDDQIDRLQDQKVEQLSKQFSLSTLKDNCDLIVNKCHKIDTKDKSVDELCESNQFYNMYHQLIHSGVFTESLMKFEDSYSVSIRELISSRDQSYQMLISGQTQEMEDAVKNIGTTFNEENINILSVKHFEDLEKFKENWNQMISNLKSQQKREFYELITKMYEDFKNGNPESVSNLRSVSVNTNDGLNFSSYDDIDWNNSLSETHNRMEESFTINLGAQLKTTHNLRLISMDILDLCRMKFGPQRIQTAMSLYSNSLSALVLLVDNRVNSYSGIKSDFAKICLKSTEFHFSDLDIQMEESRKLAQKLNRGSNEKKNSSVSLQTGDFYVTKHSNLSEVHVIYHLVCDDSLRSSEINSRHPVILGLRNIMKISHLNDVSNITIPLLLIHEMTEEITIQWCLKRAELVLKCVKGFMIEMASLSSSSDENRTVQFVVPKGISDELFSSLTTILPSIFRLSNPLVLRSSYDFE